MCVSVAGLFCVTYGSFVRLFWYSYLTMAVHHHLRAHNGLPPRGVDLLRLGAQFLAVRDVVKLLFCQFDLEFLEAVSQLGIADVCVCVCVCVCQ